MSGRVESIHVAAAKRAPMESCEAVEIRAGFGLAGDRKAGGKEKDQVTVVAQEELAVAAEACGHEIPPGATRRNITLSGVELRHEEGFRLRLGPVLLEFTQSADPCNLMNEVIGPGAEAALQDRAGMRMRVVEGGTLRVGEPVSAGPDA